MRQTSGEGCPMSAQRWKTQTAAAGAVGVEVDDLDEDFDQSWNWESHDDDTSPKLNDDDNFVGDTTKPSRRS